MKNVMTAALAMLSITLPSEVFAQDAAKSLIIAGQVVTKQYGLGYKDDDRFYIEKNVPRPLPGSILASQGFASSQSEYQNPCVNNYDPLACPASLRRFGYASTSIGASVGTGVIKAKAINYIDMQRPYSDEQESTAESAIVASSQDKFTFTGILPGQFGVLKFTHLASFYSSINNIIEDPYDWGYNLQDFSYFNSIRIFENQAELEKLEPIAKQTAFWRVCNTNFYGAICGANNLINGTRTKTQYFTLDSDDIMFLSSELELYNYNEIEYDRYNFGSRSVQRQISNFGNSGYAILKMETPGTGYLTESGDTYLSTISVPEPASWAMMLLGFGAVGVALRRRAAPEPQHA